MFANCKPDLLFIFNELKFNHRGRILYFFFFFVSPIAFKFTHFGIFESRTNYLNVFLYYFIDVLISWWLSQAP